MRRFNVTGLCVAKKHYMVDTTEKINQIAEMVENGQYFTINGARQYGKTTTLSLLRRRLQDKYVVISISFEGLGEKNFASTESFCYAFMDIVQEALERTGVSLEYSKAWLDKSVTDFNLLKKHIAKLCKDKLVVLLIDEVDKTSNNRVFLEFLSMLRDKYLKQNEDLDDTFHSVVLAGVHDIKNIKNKLIVEGSYTKSSYEGSYNSPWNIASKFTVNLSFNSMEIESMIREYETDHNTGMDIMEIAEEIYRYTSGYPFLVSGICKIIDEELFKNWTLTGVQEAVKILLKEENTLFDDLFKNLENNKELYNLVYDILIVGRQRTFTSDSPTIKLGAMYGIISETMQSVTVSNKIFELRICNYFIAKDEEKNPDRQIIGVLSTDVVKDGRFDMELCLQKFAQHYKELFADSDIEFLERHGRLLFLSYLKPLINGRGFFHIESQFTDLRRMDIVVDFGCDQFIIELKTWKGDKKHNSAYEQLNSYLVSKNADTGYLITFDFRKDVNKVSKAEWVGFLGKRIFDVIV